MKFLRCDHAACHVTVLMLDLKFDDLPGPIQEEFKRYIDQRGVNNSLAKFISTFVEYKSQKVCPCCPIWCPMYLSRF